MISFLLILLFFTKKRKCNNLDCISFPLQDTYGLEEVYQNKDTTYLAKYANNDSILRVEIIGQKKEDSQQLIRGRIARIKNQYEENISPYPGEISDSITCPSSFKPTISVINQNSLDISSFMIQLNERMTAGECQEKFIKYYSYNYYFYCQQSQKTFLVEIIYNKDQVRVDTPIFSCN
ncbi:MAG: hypothetical protein HN365_03240 [Candidatus Pacebacteria bacterium]|nr:hypothetical protein [Candidatus Paceibacterota bacterium]